MNDLEREYTAWDLRGNHRKRIGDDCYRAYQSSGEEQYLKAACRIDELENDLVELGRLCIDHRKYEATRAKLRELGIL